MNIDTAREVVAAAEKLVRRVQAGQMSAEDAVLVLRAAYPDADTPPTSHDTEATP